MKTWKFESDGIGKRGRNFGAKLLWKLEHQKTMRKKEGITLYWLQGRGGNDRDRQKERERLETVKHYALSIRRKAHKTNQSNARIMATE